MFPGLHYFCFISKCYVRLCPHASMYVYHLLPRFLWHAHIQSPHQLRILGIMFPRNLKVIICHSAWLPHTSLSLFRDDAEHKEDKGVIMENGFSPLPPGPQSAGSASVYSVRGCARLCAEGSQGTHRWESPVCKKLASLTLFCVCFCLSFPISSVR